MKFRIIKKNLNAYEKALKKGEFNDAATFFAGKFHGDSSRAVVVDVECDITEDMLAVISKVAEELNDQYAQVDSKVALQIILNKGGKIIKSLTTFKKEFHRFIKADVIDGWLYSLDLSQNLMPYLVDSITHYYADPTRDIPAHIKVKLKTISARSNNVVKPEIYLETSDVHGSTVLEVLSRKRMFKESQSLKDVYLSHLESYDEFHNKLGQQFIASNNGISGDDYRELHAKIKGNKLVNDQYDTDLMSSIEQTTVTPFFNSNCDERDEFLLYNVKDPKESPMPFHPYIKMFDLVSHQPIWVLAGDMSLYKYDTELGSKLILPDDHRDLIDVLVNDADIILEDIVSNKSGGTNILCMGRAGLGKTLTAEVYSETVQKPLYSVHSGQLGTSPDKIDNVLKEILDRAERWGAILLLDEADVYIRQRDNSMDHNAIVAAFLRNIERYDGISFMTTNRVDDVDDAIISRCAAVVKYTHPEGDELRSIWKVLSKNYNIELEDGLIDELVELFEETSGRDVKELLKLASKYKSQKNIDIDLNIFRKCAMFRGLKTKSHP
jgi:hypothetical protein